jgi:hypothetical protein
MPGVPQPLIEFGSLHDAKVAGRRQLLGDEVANIAGQPRIVGGSLEIGDQHPPVPPERRGGRIAPSGDTSNHRHQRGDGRHRDALGEANHPVHRTPPREVAKRVAKRVG